MKSLFLSVLCLFGATAAQAQFQNLPRVVADASQYVIRGCEVKLFVDGWANQLYVNGAFAGNYRNGQDDYALSNAINQNLNRGICNYKSQQEVNLIRDPNLIIDFSNFRYQNCYVKMNVSGWANQVYVRGQFVGNFKNGEEDAKLRSVLASYVMNGSCPSGYYPPQPPRPNPPHPTPGPGPGPQPQQCTCTLSNQWGNFRAVGPNCQSATQAVLNSCANSNRQAVCSGSQVSCY